MCIYALYTITTIDYNIANNHTIVIVYEIIYTIEHTKCIYHTIVESYTVHTVTHAL